MQIACAGAGAVAALVAALVYCVHRACLAMERRAWAHDRDGYEIEFVPEDDEDGGIEWVPSARS